MWPTNAGGAIGEDNWQKFQIGPPIVSRLVTQLSVLTERAQLTFQLLQNGPGSYESPLTSPFRPIQVPEPSVRSPDSVLVLQEFPGQVADHRSF
ncbi:hypothetical protein LINPERHAP1_LOCUS21205 [Linum perenne]